MKEVTSMKKTKTEIEGDFHLLKSVLTFKDAEKYCNNFDDSKFSVYVNLLDLVSNSDAMSILGVGYLYYEGKPLGRCQAEIMLDGLRLASKEFRSRYEGKMFKVPLKALPVSPYATEINGDVGALVIYLKGIDFLEEIF